MKLSISRLRSELLDHRKCFPVIRAEAEQLVQIFPKLALRMGVKR